MFNKQTKSRFKKITHLSCGVIKCPEDLEVQAVSKRRCHDHVFSQNIHCLASQTDAMFMWLSHVWQVGLCAA